MSVVWWNLFRMHDYFEQKQGFRDNFFCITDKLSPFLLQFSTRRSIDNKMQSRDMRYNYIVPNDRQIFRLLSQNKVDYHQFRSIFKYILCSFKEISRSLTRNFLFLALVTFWRRKLYPRFNQKHFDFFPEKLFSRLLTVRPLQCNWKKNKRSL